MRPCVGGDVDVELLWSGLSPVQMLEEALKRGKDSLVWGNELNCLWQAVIYEEGALILGPSLLSCQKHGRVVEYYLAKGLSVEVARRIGEEYQKLPVLSYPYVFYGFPSCPASRSAPLFP